MTTMRVRAGTSRTSGRTTWVRERWRPAARILGASIAALLVVACSGLQPRTEPVSEYALAAQPLQRSTAPPRDVVLGVAPPSAWPGFDTARMIYVQQPNVLDSFAASRWVEPPARMLGPLLARALEQTGSFRTVVQLPGGVPVDLKLDTEIVRMQHDFTVRPSQVQLTMRVQLTDVRARRVVASAEFEAVQRASAENAAGGVVAANAAMQQLLERVAQFCVSPRQAP